MTKKGKIWMIFFLAMTLGVLFQTAPECQARLYSGKCKSNMTFGEFLPQLSLKVGSRNYQLHFGRQWVGRKKEGNDAEVQILD